MNEKYKVDHKQFAAHLVEFAEDEWLRFVDWSESFDYTEDDLEEGCDQIRKNAGQVV